VVKRKVRRQRRVRAKRVYAQTLTDERVLSARRTHRNLLVHRVAGTALAVVAAVVAGTHLLDHQNAFHLLRRQVLEDLVVGYPTALLLLIAAAIVAWPREPHNRHPR
jgi:hypothetical protein